MINARGVSKKKFEQPQKPRPKLSSRGKANCSPIELDRSLLIHDDRTDHFSDTSFSLKEIHDKDIPIEKRNVINDPGYFKQLSLSFYGTTPSPTRSLTKMDNKQHNPKKVVKKLDTSLSPRSRTEYYYGIRKSPVAQFDKDPFQINIANVVRKGQTEKSLSSSRLNLSQTKENAEMKSPRSIGRIELKNLKASKTSLKNVLMTQVKGDNNNSKVVYSQLTTGNTTCSTATPRYTNFWDKELIKDINRQDPKKVTKTKTTKAVTKEYLITEPDVSGMKNSNSSSTILKNLKKKGDNTNILNFKVVMGSDGQIQSHRAVAQEKAPTRASITSIAKKIQGPTSSKGITLKSVYFNS